MKINTTTRDARIGRALALRGAKGIVTKSDRPLMPGQRLRELARGLRP